MNQPLRWHTVFFLFLFLHLSSFAQTPYFQQEVNYNIRVALNDARHELSAFESITYINNSSTSLDVLYFHLWPNAYKNQETALAKQLLENGETAMYYAKPEELGFIDSLDFRINGRPLKWELDPEHIDICKLYLPSPLRSNDSIVITTPFHVKLPSARLSRLGHIGQAYAITQWYPKPAVYDNEGWHAMPYLNQGEFFSEFGSFDVSITLPKNYLLAATGDRIDATEEEAWLDQKVKETEQLVASNGFSTDESFPASSAELKTVRFRQYRVHDFAWFADKRFHVLKDEVLVPVSGNKVTTWAFFTNNEPYLWENALTYINDATLFYSYMLGDYPYNQVTAVDGTISAGGGMEYPNITIIGQSHDPFTLETTIMHEVGHNWFYGMLGSNERDCPAMDEGLNSFYEMRYIRTKYPEKKLTSLIDQDSSFTFFGLNRFPHKAEYEVSYYLAARRNTDQPIDLAAPEFTKYNYGAIVYSKTALAFDYLMNYLGKDKFDEAMQFYFENWKYKHPSPKDLLSTLQYHLNSDLSWFATEMVMSTRKVDYKMKRHKQLPDHSHLIVVKNSGQVPGPVSVAGIKNGKVIGEVWYNGFKGKKTMEFPPSDVDEFRIDYHEFIPEINRKNNNIRTKGLFRKAEPLQLNFVGKLDDPRKTQINFLPAIGYNSYNKFMLGAVVYNYTLLQRKLEYTVAPLFAFGNKDLAGFADLRLNLTPDGIFQQITLGSAFKRYAYNHYSFDNFNNNNALNYQAKSFYTTYNKIAPFVELELRKKQARSPITQTIRYTYNQILLDELGFKGLDNSGSTLLVPKRSNNQYYVNNLSYTLRNKRVINPFDATVQLDHNWEMAKASVTFNYAITFKQKNTLDFRLFAGTFLFQNKAPTRDYRFRMSGWTGYQDYAFDYNYIGRNEYTGLAAQQFIENDGAFKVPTFLGQTSKWLVALNIKSPRPGKLPLRLFVDVGSCEFNDGLIKQKVLYDAGVEIQVIKGILEIYVPVLYSQDIGNALTANNKGFWDTIRFTLNLHNVRLRNLILTNLF